MEFARRQLEKYGWSHGKGLGRHEDGIPEALRPKMKRSSAGVGHDAGADFTDHWWSALYDKASGNIEVEETEGTTNKIKTIDPDAVEICDKTWKINSKKRKKHKKSDESGYMENFVRTAVLMSGGVKTERLEGVDADEVTDVRMTVVKLTDEELFSACGGRTAHKGARHGLRAMGKLARIEQQEKALLTQPQYEGYSHTKRLKLKNKQIDISEKMESASLEVDVSEQKKKRKKKKYCNDRTEMDEENEIIELADDDLQVAKVQEGKIKKKYKIKCSEGNVNETEEKKIEMDVNEEVETDTNEVKNNIYSKEKVEIDGENEVIELIDDDLKVTKKQGKIKKKSKKNRHIESGEDVNETEENGIKMSFTEEVERDKNGVKKDKYCKVRMEMDGENEVIELADDDLQLAKIQEGNIKKNSKKNKHIQGGENVNETEENEIKINVTEEVERGTNGVKRRKYCELKIEMDGDNEVIELLDDDLKVAKGQDGKIKKKYRNKCNGKNVIETEEKVIIMDVHEEVENHTNGANKNKSKKKQPIETIVEEIVPTEVGINVKPEKKRDKKRKMKCD